MTEPVRTLWKQPRESILFDFDFSEAGWIAEGESIAQVDNVLMELVTGSGEIQLGSPGFSGTRAQVRISGGVGGSTHLLTCLVTDTAQNTWELEGYLEIVERPEA